MGLVGVIVNPLAGKDIRRLVGQASHISDATKVGMIRRAVAGAVEGGAERIVVSDDRHHLSRRAIDRMQLADVEIDVLSEPLSGDRLDTVAAAAQLAKQEAGAVIVLGGDGTNRDVATGWPDAPIVPVSTGTNNVFPVAWDVTAAGTAAGLVASGQIALAEASRPAKRIVARIERSDGQPDDDDVALVDVALLDGRFVGARAVWRAGTIRHLIAAIATPAGTGLSSIAGRVRPVDRWSAEGVLVDFGADGRLVRVPLQPGTFETVSIARVAGVALDEPVAWQGPGVLAFDGERTHVLGHGDDVTLTVVGDGPMVIDVERVLAAAVDRGCFDVDRLEDLHGH